jgi:hypothetical protein
LHELGIARGKGHYAKDNSRDAIARRRGKELTLARRFPWLNPAAP